MLPISDFKTDLSDDIILNGDIILEDDHIISSIKVAERRIMARYDDFMLNNVAAGIERHLYDKVDENIISLIRSDVTRALSANDLFNKLEYKTLVKDLDNRKIQVFIKFLTPAISADYSFKVIINQENQRSYN